jgi:hypothetical protein
MCGLGDPDDSRSGDRRYKFFALGGLNKICAEWFLRPLKRAGTRGCFVVPSLATGASVLRPRCGLGARGRFRG